MKTPKKLPIPNQKKKQIISVRPSGSQPIQKLTEKFAPHSTNSCGKGYFYLEILPNFSPGKGVWGGRYNVLRNKKSRSNPEFFSSVLGYTLGITTPLVIHWWYLFFGIYLPTHQNTGRPPFKAHHVHVNLYRARSCLITSLYGYQSWRAARPGELQRLLWSGWIVPVQIDMMLHIAFENS